MCIVTDTTHSLRIHFSPFGVPSAIGSVCNIIRFHSIMQMSLLASDSLVRHRFLLYQLNMYANRVCFLSRVVTPPCACARVGKTYWWSSTFHQSWMWEHQDWLTTRRTTASPVWDALDCGSWRWRVDCFPDTGYNRRILSLTPTTRNQRSVQHLHRKQHVIPRVHGWNIIQPMPCVIY